MMPRRSRPLRARARAGIRSTTIKNPGARCAPARNINRGSQPSATTALLPPSRPTLARHRQARSLNYPGPSRRCLLRQRAATPKPVPLGARQCPAHAAAVPSRSPSLSRKRVQTEVPSDLPLHAPTAAGTPPETPCRCAAHPWQATGLSGTPAPATCPPYKCRLPADLTEGNGIGMGTPGALPVHTRKV
jgi:hypothetical protein